MTARFSLVVPTYNVERYLDEFLASLAEQSYPVSEIEIVFVDDGSTDASAEIIAKWIAAIAPSATLLQNDNGGLSSARNAGLDTVTGTWVTFCDPDDTLEPDYFATVARFLSEHDGAGIDLVACRLLMLDDRTGELADTHPLRFRFARGDRIVDLERQPRFIHLSAASGFYRTGYVAEHGLRFDHRVRPSFEDAHFTGLYLAGRPRPRVAFLRDAIYRYRRRADESSLVQAGWYQPERITEIPRYGHLDLLRRVGAARGAIPIWLQNLVLYDLFYPFKYDERFDSPLAAVDPGAAERFHELLPEIVGYIDTATIENYRVSVVSADIRNALIIGVKCERTRPDRIRLDRIDADQRLAQLRYYFGGDLPREQFRCREEVTMPAHSKSRPITFLGRHMVSERIVWLPAEGPIEVTLDGRPTPIAIGDDTLARSVVDPARRWRRLASVVPASPYDDAPRPRQRPIERRHDDWYWTVRRQAAHTFRVYHRTVARLRGHRRNRRYRDAWVFIDRPGVARDNAEHLYRFVRVHHPEINAWFVVDRESRDWQRLAEEGFRLVPSGTPEHVLLMLNCAELISSRLDDGAVTPLDKRRFGKGRWRLTFVPHRVTTEDLSRWVNRAPVRRLATASEAEYWSIAGDGTPYVLTDKEVALTGIARHDRLLRLAHDPGIVAANRLLLIMPTSRREMAVPSANRWLDLLGADRLRTLAERAGLRVVFAPHHSVPEYTTAAFPSHVEVHDDADVDLQELFARGAAIITDYSANAFELAYLNRPVIYFQSDHQQYFTGRDGYRRGDWSYEHDGFGPVVGHVTAVLDEFERLVDRGMAPQEPFATRMAQGFAFRDGRCCERVFESILAMRDPASKASE